jgi:hypothetical protein
MKKLVFDPNTIYTNKIYRFMPGGSFIQMPTTATTTLEQPDTKTLHRMTFISNALDKGWSVKKRNDSYIFTKKHEGKREIFQNTYLDTFIGEMI